MEDNRLSNCVKEPGCAESASYVCACYANSLCAYACTTVKVACSSMLHRQEHGFCAFSGQSEPLLANGSLHQHMQACLLQHWWRLVRHETCELVHLKNTGSPVDLHPADLEAQARLRRAGVLLLALLDVARVRSRVPGPVADLNVNDARPPVPSRHVLEFQQVPALQLHCAVCSKDQTRKPSCCNLSAMHVTSLRARLHCVPNEVLGKRSP